MMPLPLTDERAELALGTVQFGLAYGVSNAGGQTPMHEVARILDAARAYGIRLLDTAAAYGDSETVLGELAGPRSGFEIVTKSPKLDGKRPAAVQVNEACAVSLKRLRRDRLYGLLVHDFDDLLAAEGWELYGALQELKQAGLVERIGASVYDPAQVEELIDRSFDFDFVQLPFSLLDQRMRTSGALARLAADGVEVHVRSCFLQGALLMPPAQLPEHLLALRGRLEEYRAAVRECGLTPLAGALAFVRDCPGVDAVVVGVCDKGQFDEIAHAAAATLPEGIATELFAVDDPELIDPRKWPRSH